MVRGMLALLKVCPHEVAHLRKELLIAARHILATELRIKFVPLMEKLFDENILLGKGWTTHESLRPLAYSTLADLVSTRKMSCALEIGRACIMNCIVNKSIHLVQFLTGPPRSPALAPRGSRASRPALFAQRPRRDASHEHPDHVLQAPSQSGRVHQAEE